MQYQTHSVNPVDTAISAGLAGSLGDAAGGNGTFPPLPNFPPSGAYDPTQDPNWPYQVDGSYQPNGFNDDGFMQAFTNALTYIDAHPSDPQGYINLARIAYRLNGLTQGGKTLLSIVEDKLQNEGVSLTPIGQMISSGIWYASQFGFLYGYPQGAGNQGTAAGYTGFADALAAQLPSSSSDPFIQAMINANGVVNTGAGTFVSDHIYTPSPGTPTTDAYGNPMQAGDIVYIFKENDGTGNLISVYYDWSAAIRGENGDTSIQGATTTLQRIESAIEDSDGAGGSAGTPNPEVDELGQMLNGIQINDSLDTFLSILKSTGDVGMAILAFFFEWEGYSMNSNLSGPADVMDKEKRLSQWAKQIEDDLKELQSVYAQGSTAGQPGTVSPQEAQAAQRIAADTLALFDSINGSGQFSQGLGSAVQSALQTFFGTTITYTYTPTSGTPMAPQTFSVMKLFVMAANGSITSQELGQALAQGINPLPPTPPTGTDPTPFSGGGDSGSVALQGILGGFDGLVTAVSSDSSAQVAGAQEGESKINAMDKVMTLVTDKTSGINTAVINKTLTLPA